MHIYRSAVVAVVLSLLLAGCAKPPQRIADDSSAQTASAPASKQSASISKKAYAYSELTGRILRVSERGDIQLRRGEVILTFDDGPSPKLTSSILDTLDTYDVKATFLIVGRMAHAHPEMVQEVALRGHTIGTHTHDHEDLSHETHNSAMSKINAGYRAVARALEPIGKRPSPFFRFPYLASTKLLRASLADDRMVVLGVEIDSEDYRKSTSEEVMQRTLKRLEARGRGIVLFHDIQARTARMLPAFLKELSARGYEVVHIVPDKRGLFRRALVTAGLDTR